MNNFALQLSSPKDSRIHNTLMSTSDTAILMIGVLLVPLNFVRMLSPFITQIILRHIESLDEIIECWARVSWISTSWILLDLLHCTINERCDIFLKRWCAILEVHNTGTSIISVWFFNSLLNWNRSCLAHFWNLLQCALCDCTKAMQFRFRMGDFDELFA